MWKFSDEVQPELQHFLNTVSQKSLPNNRIKNIFNKIHPQIQTPSDQCTINEDENNSTQILNTTEICHEISALNLTSATISTSSSHENLLNPEVNNFIEFIEENLEDAILEKNDVIKLSDYNTNSLTHLFNKLLEVISDRGLYNLNRSFCAYPDVNSIDRVVEQFCRHLLLPKILNSNLSQILQSLLKEIIDVYPQITRRELLIPLLNIEASTKCLQFVINILPEIENQYFLRDFIYSCNELENWQLETLQNLLGSKTEDAVKRRLITLMEASADKFCSEKLFLKLVIKLIQNLGEGFDDQEEALHNIIEKNKTLLRISGQKALREFLQKVAEGIF